MIKKLNKVKKGMAALLVAAMCMIPGISSVAAAPTYSPNQSYTCDWCGVGMVYEYFTYTPEVVYKEVKCTHNLPYGTDIIYEYTITKTLICDYCGRGYSDPPVTHYTTKCHGYTLEN